MRSEVHAGLFAEATLFRLDFENQIVPASVAGGTRRHAHERGATLQQGLEVAGNVENNGFVDWPVEVFGRLSYTWLPTAEYEGNRFSTVPGFTNVRVTGNPPAVHAEEPAHREPRHAHVIQAQRGGRGRVQQLGLHRRPQHRGDHAERAARRDAGLHAVEPERELSRGAVDTNLFVTVKNLTDELYIVDMSRGIVAGMPRLVQGGFEIRF